MGAILCNIGVLPCSANNTPIKVLYSLDHIHVRLGGIAPDVRAIIWFAEDRLRHSLLMMMVMISRLWWTLCEASHQLS